MGDFQDIHIKDPVPLLDRILADNGVPLSAEVDNSKELAPFELPFNLFEPFLDFPNFYRLNKGIPVFFPEQCQDCTGTRLCRSLRFEILQFQLGFNMKCPQVREGP